MGGLGFAGPGVKQGDRGNGGHSGARLSQEERKSPWESAETPEL